MERKLILRKISEIIVDLQEQSQSLTNHVGPINEIELELFIANTKFLSDHALILQKINTVSQPTSLEEKTVIGTLEDLPEIEEPELAEEELIEEEELVQMDEAILEEPVVEEVLPHVSEAVAEACIMETSEPLVPIEAILPETENKKLTVNDLMANQPDQNRATKFGSEPVKDLKSIISLNDKLVFVKDLFSGYSLAYQEAIDTLNRLADFDAADQFLQTNYVEKYKWAEQTKTVERFYELLNRRFAK